MVEGELISLLWRILWISLWKKWKLMFNSKII
jgi:hypothetical protein